MQNARLAYGALIRQPIIGPLARLPLRLLRWLLQPPDHDPSARVDDLTLQLSRLRDQHDRLALAHETLCRDQERTRLILFMISGQFKPSNADGPGLQNGRHLQHDVQTRGQTAGRTAGQTADRTTYRRSRADLG